MTKTFKQIRILLNSSKDFKPQRSKACLIGLFCAFFFCGIFLCNNVFAANLYVLDGGTSSTCTSWTDACDQLTTAETLIQNAGRSTGGDTVYIADGTYNGLLLNTPESGTSVITIKRCAVSDATCTTATGYSATDHDGQTLIAGAVDGLSFQTGYWVVDGLTGGGPTSWNTGFGIKVAYTGAADAIMISKTGSSITDIALRHIQVEGLGREVANANYGTSLKCLNCSNITVSYCHLYKSFKGIADFQHGSNIIVEYSKLGPNGKSSPAEESIHGFGLGGRDLDTYTIRYNLFEDIAETYYIGFTNDAVGEIAKDCSIYGNIFWESRTLAGTTNIKVVGLSRPNTTVTNFKFYNNTIVNMLDGGLG